MKNINLVRIRLVGLVFLMVIFSTIFIPLTSAEDEDSDAIILIFSFNPPELRKATISNTSYDRVIMECLPSIGNNGTPILPVKPMKVLLPQKSVLESIDVICEGNTSLGYGYNVELGTEPRNLTGGEQNGSDGSNFDPSIPYPTDLFLNVGTYNLRGYSILTLNLYPVHYIGDTGELYYYEEMTVIVRTCGNGSVSPWFRGLVKDEMMVKQAVDDYTRIDSYTSSLNSTGNSSLVDPSGSYDYVIDRMITS